MRKNMRRLLVLTALGAVVTLAGCGSGGLFGLRKPQPKVRAVVLNRQNSSLAVYVQGFKPNMDSYAVWKIDQGDQRRNVDFANARYEADGDNGVFIFVLAHPWSEAVDLTSTYSGAFQVSAEVWDYDASYEGATTRRSSASLWSLPATGSAFQTN